MHTCTPAHIQTQNIDNDDKNNDNKLKQKSDPKHLLTSLYFYISTKVQNIIF